jgi:predicted nucleotidyltransferase
MRLNKPLNKILNSETKIKVLRLFCSGVGESTGRQVAKLLNVAQSPVQIALADLYNEGILDRKSFGKAFAYGLNSRNWLVESSLRPMFRAESEYPEKLWAKIRQRLEGAAMGGQILSASLFGSVLTGQDRATSDIDLLVILKDDAEKQAVEDVFIDMNRGVIEETGLNLDAYIYSVSEAREKIADGVTFLKEAIQANKLILGKSPGECL